MKERQPRSGINDFAKENTRFGHRRIHVLFRGDGSTVNTSRYLEFGGRRAGKRLRVAVDGAKLAPQRTLVLRQNQSPN